MLRLRREGLVGVEASSGADVQQWAMERAAREVEVKGWLTPRLRLLGDGFQLTLPLDPLVQQGQHVGATLWALARTPGVARALIEGTARDPSSADPVAFLFDLDLELDPPQWWLGTRPYTRGEGEIGRFAGPWVQAEGDEAALSPDLLAILRPPGDAVAATVLPAAEQPPGDVALSLLTLGEGVQLASDAVALTQLTAAIVEGEVLREGLQAIVVFAFRGRQVERWDIRPRSGAPMDVDDVARAICLRAGTPDGLAVVRLGLLQLRGEKHRALHTTAEQGGQRAQRSLVLRFPPGAAAPVPGAVYTASLGAADEHNGWIGVEPLVHYQLMLQEG